MFYIPDHLQLLARFAVCLCMSFSLWFRNNITDRANAPLRRQIAEMIPEGSSVLEIGCANGRLLAELSDKISQGMGVDRDSEAIFWAQSKYGQYNGRKIQFICSDAADLATHLNFKPDVGIAALCLHEMPRNHAASLLKKLSGLTSVLLLADLFESASLIPKAALHADEMIAGHYRRFLDYKRHGGMPGLLNAAGINSWQTLDTFNPSIRIWSVEF